MAAFSTHPTPNPNSLKFTAKKRSFVESGMESYNSPSEAAGHPLAERLFALPGVANVFILPQFLTLTKHPAADWSILLPKVEKALEAHLTGADLVE